MRAFYSSAVDLVPHWPNLVLSSKWVGLACVWMTVHVGEAYPTAGRRFGSGLFLGLRVARVSIVTAIRTGPREHHLDVEVNF